MNAQKISFKRFTMAALAVMSSLALVVSLWGCAGNNSSSSGGSATKKVCFVEIVDNDAFATMIDGFKKQMEASGYKDVQYDTKNAQGDQSTLNQIAAQLKNSDYDVIVPIATPPAQACVNANISKPMVFMSVTDPVNAGVTSTLEKPDKGMTGTTNFADVEAIFNFGKELIPNVYNKPVGIIYCSSDTNSEATANDAVDYLKGQGIQTEVRTVSTSSEVQQAGQALAATCGSIYVPADSIVQVSMAALTDVATKAGIPVFGTDPVMTETGALQSVSCTNDNVGAESAKLAIQLLEGKQVSELPVYVLPSIDKSVNRETAKALGVNIDENSTEYRVI